MNGVERVDEEGKAEVVARWFRRASGVTLTMLGIADQRVVLRTSFAPYVIRASSIAVARNSGRTIELAWFSVARPANTGHPTVKPPPSLGVDRIDVFAATLRAFDEPLAREIAGRVDEERERSLNALDPVLLDDFAMLADEVASSSFTNGS